MPTGDVYTDAIAAPPHFAWPTSAALGNTTDGQNLPYVGGWLQQGFTFNFDDPANGLNTPVLFNDLANDYRLNQLNVFAEIPVRQNGLQWEIGGRIDALFGSDSRFLTVPGLEEHRDGTTKWNDDDYGVALPQAYLQVAAPWLHGLSLKLGHFYSPVGFETIPAPQNLFYSHAYTFLYGEPFTHTGGLFELRFNDYVTLHAGATNGWDNFHNSSDLYGVLTGFTLASADRSSFLKVTVHSGPDLTNVRVNGLQMDDDRHLYSIVFQRRISQRLVYVFQHDFGYQENGKVVVDRPTQRITFSAAKWYGINQYLIYQVSDIASTALRVEWFRDQDHSRLGVPVAFSPGGDTFLGGSYIATTLGLRLTPHPNVLIRPEIRWDYSDVEGNGAAPGGDASLRVFGDKRRSSQITAGIDVTLVY